MISRLNDDAIGANDQLTCELASIWGGVAAATRFKAGCTVLIISSACSSACSAGCSGVIGSSDGGASVLFAGGVSSFSGVVTVCGTESLFSVTCTTASSVSPTGASSDKSSASVSTDSGARGAVISTASSTGTDSLADGGFVTLSSDVPSPDPPQADTSNANAIGTE